MTLYGVELSLCSDAEEVASVVADELVARRPLRRVARPHRRRHPGPRLRARGRARARLERRLALVGRRALRAAGRRALELPARARDPARPARGRRPRGAPDPRRARRAKRRRASTTSSLRGAQLDYVLLGIGPDGHTASLFPLRRRSTSASGGRFRAEPKLEPFVERVTLTVPVLCSAPEVVFIVTGEEKAEAVERAFGRPPGPGDAREPDSVGRGTHACGRGRRGRVAIVCLDSSPTTGYTAAWPPPNPSRSWTS